MSLEMLNVKKHKRRSKLLFIGCRLPDSVNRLCKNCRGGPWALWEWDAVALWLECRTLNRENISDSNQFTSISHIRQAWFVHLALVHSDV